MKVEKLACPLPLTATLAARVVSPSVKVTVPVVTGLPPAATVAVKVTFCPVREGLSEEVTEVLVAVTDAAVMFSVQPPMEPASGQASSITYRLQVPLGTMPLNAARVVLLEGAGAGEGNVSAPDSSV